MQGSSGTEEVESVRGRRRSWKPPTATQRGDRAWHRPLSVGLLLAVLIHLIILLIFRTVPIPESPFSAAGPRMGDVRAAAGGGSGLEVVQVAPPSQREEAVVPVETPVPVPEEVTVEEETPEEAEEPAPEPSPSQPGTGAPGSGGVLGEEVGPGRESGTGEGGGGTGDAGESDITPPRPRAMFLPPANRPASVRGREVTVWVYVDTSGRVVSDQTRLEPPTPDGGYNRRLIQSAAQWRFEPARQAGRAVAAWYPYEIIL